MSQIRRCPGWGDNPAHELFETEFYDEPKRSGGKSLYCKRCHAERMKAYWKKRYYPEHAEELKAAVKRRRAEAKGS